MSYSLKNFIPALKPAGKIAFDIGGTGTTTSPTYALFYSADGTKYYLFVDNSGDLKVHTAIPTANTDGSVVGSQS